MKNSSIIAIIAIAVGIAVLISASGDTTKWSDFKKAEESGEVIKLTGFLVKDKPVEYNPETNADLLKFWLKDESGEVRQVVLHAAKPQDFERSESIVLTGKAANGVFEASDMLLKCPSKYKDQEDIYVKSKEG